MFSLDVDERSVAGGRVHICVYMTACVSMYQVVRDESADE